MHTIQCLFYYYIVWLTRLLPWRVIESWDSLTTCLIATSEFTKFLSFGCFLPIPFALQLFSIFSFLFLQVWGTLIMQKRYKGQDYLLAVLVTFGCSIFILYPVITSFGVLQSDYIYSASVGVCCVHSISCNLIWSFIIWLNLLFVCMCVCFSFNIW